MADDFNKLNQDASQARHAEQIKVTRALMDEGNITRQEAREALRSRAAESLREIRQRPQVQVAPPEAAPVPAKIESTTVAFQPRPFTLGQQSAPVVDAPAPSLPTVHVWAFVDGTPAEAQLLEISGQEIES